MSTECVEMAILCIRQLQTELSHLYNEHPDLISYFHYTQQLDDLRQNIVSAYERLHPNRPVPEIAHRHEPTDREETNP